jgi:hypothetical protein
MVCFLEHEARDALRFRLFFVPSVSRMCYSTGSNAECSCIALEQNQSQKVLTTCKSYF